MSPEPIDRGQQQSTAARQFLAAGPSRTCIYDGSHVAGIEVLLDEAARGGFQDRRPQGCRVEIVEHDDVDPAVLTFSQRPDVRFRRRGGGMHG